MVSFQRVLLAEPDGALRSRLRKAVRERAQIDCHSDFVSARTNLLSKPYDWLVTNIRLDEYNGLHLVYLAGAVGLAARVLVYDDLLDLELARQAQQAGAFFESRQRVHLALAAYLRGTLPAFDRRDPARPDRRAFSRGSRRCTDLVHQERLRFKASASCF
jgi:DNA-binding NtrC family response regulator